MADAALAPLLAPLTIASSGLTLRNRVTMSALTRSRSVPTNVPNALNVEYYRQRAKGGAGLIVTEGTLIVQQGTEWQNAPGIWSQEHVAAWKKVTDAVHEEGGLIFCQLWHLGRVSHPDAPEQVKAGYPVYAPSAISARGGKFRFIPGTPGYVTPTYLEDPWTIVEKFKNAAENAKAAGFDGVELHGANGYLVHQFLDSTSNLRTDQWGGSVENRARFGLECLKALIGVWGPGRVSVKLSPPGGYNDMGMPLQETIDQFGYFITEADKLDLAYITLTRYNAGLDPEFDGKKRGTDFDVLETLRPFFKKNNLFLNNGLSPQEAAGFIKEGKIAAAVFGWLWIGHPDLANRLIQGKPLDNQVDIPNLYGHGGTEEQERVGYSSYPAAT